MTMKLYEKEESGVHILSVEGFIDTSTSTEIEEKIKKMLAENKVKLVVDMSKTEFVSSAGWGVFVAYLRKMRSAGGDIRLAGMAEKVEKVFTLMEFDSLIDYYRDVDEAKKGF